MPDHPPLPVPPPPAAPAADPANLQSAQALDGSVVLLEPSGELGGCAIYRVRRVVAAPGEA